MTNLRYEINTYDLYKHISYYLQSKSDSRFLKVGFNSKRNIHKKKKKKTKTAANIK